MPQLITEIQAAKVATALQDWLETPEQKTIADLLSAIQRPVGQMVQNGVSYKEIAQELLTLEIAVTTDVISTYFTSLKAKQKQRKSKSSSPELEQVVSDELFEKAVAHIKELAKQKRGLTRLELVQQNYQVIELLLAAGKTFPKIADFLETKQGINIAATTLAKYHRQAKKHQTLVPDGHKEAPGLVSSAERGQVAAGTTLLPESVSQDELLAEFM